MKVKNPRGRPKVTNELRDLLLARAKHEAAVSPNHMQPLFGVTKTTAKRQIAEVEQNYPEFVEFLDGLREGSVMISRKEITTELIRREEVRTQDELSERLTVIKGNLANAVESVLCHLLDMTELELKTMKTEHKLRYIPELVKVMRLLREQSTENVQKLSLVKAISIATARRQPEDTTATP